MRTLDNIIPVLCSNANRSSFWGRLESLIILEPSRESMAESLRISYGVNSQSRKASDQAFHVFEQEDRARNSESKSTHFFCYKDATDPRHRVESNPSNTHLTCFDQPHSAHRSSPIHHSRWPSPTNRSTVSYKMTPMTSRRLRRRDSAAEFDGPSGFYLSELPEDFVSGPCGKSVGEIYIAS